MDEQKLREILIAVEGHGKYHTSGYDGPVMTVEDASAALNQLHQDSLQKLERKRNVRVTAKFEPDQLNTEND